MKPLYSLVLAGAVAISASAAVAAEQTMIVLDASGSMWGQINGKPKLQIAREALSTVLDGVPGDMELGLIAYGHRERGNCGDIEVVVKPAAGTGPAIAEAAANMRFLGKTPLSAAVIKAAQELRHTEEKATVILITDGLENCNADPCAVGAQLAEQGIDFTAHVVGFDLTDAEGKQVACLAENTGGRYISAANADELRDALLNTVQPVAAKQPEPLVLPEASLDPDESAAIGSDIKVNWSGPNAENDYIDIVPVGYRPTHGELAFSYTTQGSPLTVRAPGKPGSYQVRYIWRGTDGNRHILASSPVEVTDSDVALVAPDTIGAGSFIPVQWKGPANENDYIDLVPAGHTRTSGELTYKYTKADTEPEIELRAPTKPGAYNIRYILNGADQKRVLESITITVTEATATLSIPEEVEAGAGFTMFWTGPAGDSDYVDIVPKGHTRTSGELTFFYLKNSEDGETHEMSAPSKTGEYQVRYVLRGAGADAVLVSQPFTVTAAEGHVSVPETVLAGSAVPIDWSGPAGENDYIDIVPSDHKRIGGELTFFYTRNALEGGGDELPAPTKAGEYQVRYILRGAGSDSVLTQQSFIVEAAQGSVWVPDTVSAGSLLQVDWSGPAGQEDYIDIVPADHSRIGGELTFFYTRNSELGEPGELNAPAKAGDYFVRYILRGSGPASVLARHAFTVSQPQASLSLPSSVPVESAIQVEWSGPANHEDYIDIVPAGHKRVGGELTYVYTRNLEEGEPAELTAPKKAGEYLLRYILRGSGPGIVLATESFSVTEN